ncbi:hypothetical protein [Paucilactobacillus hokkaidonensis]|uniref:hypothetical protein n=1 Tax=Paucilactobacillus hokkaidonensis TaxID=1193095 RepID=UPI0006CFFC6C|nr:hypothetical protein [Paucilactobacillus hokkaidonensis]
MNKKNIKVYKSCLLAGFALVSLSLATGVKADQVESNSLSVSISTSNLNSVSAQSSVSSNVSAASSSAAPASENTAVSANENTNEDHSASSVTNSQQGAGVISTSAVPDSTANTNSGVASASETNLGDVDNAAVDVAKSAAVVSYEATGQVQKVTRSSAVSTTEVVSNGWSANTTGTKYFYKDGQKANGYLYDGSNWYLFKDGLRQSDVQQWAGTYYYFDHNTYLRVDNSYVKSSWGDWYLFGNDGRITTNVQQWAGTYYYFDPSTYLKVTNAYKKSSWGDWYMFGNDGRIVTGLCYWQGSYYYFDSTSFF